jgi:hypothetical protein
VFEVSLVFRQPSQEIRRGWFLDGTGLLLRYITRLPSGPVTSGITVSNDLGDWLTTNCASWRTIEEQTRSGNDKSLLVYSGVILGFSEAGDAVLTKLTWGGL